MATELSFDVAHTALLAMDCQAGLVSTYVPAPEEFMDRAAAVAKAARDRGVRVIHVKVGFRPGMPEIGPRSRAFHSIKSRPGFEEFMQGPTGDIHPKLGPESGDLVIVKHRISAFSGTDLEMILRAWDLHTLVLFGIATSGVVLSTLLDACDRDYNSYVISDCCADTNLELHDALIRGLFPKRGEVLTAVEFKAALPSA